MSHTQSDDSPDDKEVYPFLIDAPDNRGQHNFCKNLLVNLFEPGISPCKAEFPDIKIKRQIIEHYLKDICNLTQQYGIYTIEFSTPNTNHRKYVIQTDDLELEFSKVFLEYIKSIQYHNSQRANSIFTNEIFAIIYTYISILEKTEFQSISPTETSKHTKVRNEIALFSTFLHIIKENFTKDDVSQHTKHDLQKILAWFIIDYFTHTLDLISQARKNFRLQNSKHRYRSSTPKHQRHINQVQSNEETTSDPPGIDDTGSNELQLNQINCGSSDTESDTENTISVNMITVENDYEPIIYEQPITSHIYENQLELLHNYYLEPIDTTQTTQKVNEINRVIKPNEKDKTKCSNTNHIYQNIQKEQPREKIWTIPFLLESPRNKKFQPTDLEIDFLIDSGAESKIINIPTWNEIKTLHLKLTPLATSSKLATAQGQLFLPIIPSPHKNNGAK